MNTHTPPPHAPRFPEPLQLSFPPLSNRASISLLTAEPASDAVYTLYGHAALRVSDPDANLDIVFNYGIFDFQQPHFVLRFLQGHTDYILATAPFHDFLDDYLDRRSNVYQQSLNLSHTEVQSLFNILATNALPQFRSYRYNFISDNCATRIPHLIRHALNASIRFAEPPASPSFRQMINFCARQHPWLAFATDLALGAPADRTPSPHQQLFLPLYLHDAVNHAVLVPNDPIYASASPRQLLRAHTTFPNPPFPPPFPTLLAPPQRSSPIRLDALFSTKSPARNPHPNLFLDSPSSPPSSPADNFTTLVSTNPPPLPPSPPNFTSPLAAFWLLFALALYLSCRHIRRHIRVPIILFDAPLFLTAALAGSLITFLSCFSTHPLTSPNFVLLWLNPLYFAPIPSLFFRIAPTILLPTPVPTPINPFFAAISLLLSLSLLLYPFIPQLFNPAAFPIIFTLLLRAALLSFPTNDDPYSPPSPPPPPHSETR